MRVAISRAPAASESVPFLLQFSPSAGVFRPPDSRSKSPDNKIMLTGFAIQKLAEIARFRVTFENHAFRPIFDF